MFGIGLFEFALIVMIALILFGPQKLPEILRQIQQFLTRTKDAANRAKSAFEEDVWSLDQKSGSKQESESSTIETKNEERSG
jgi:Tat protein translocase TatB subunit